MNQVPFKIEASKRLLLAKELDKAEEGRFNDWREEADEDENYIEAAPKKWSKNVKTKWEPPEGLFSEGSASDIASAIHRAHKDLRSAMGSLNFYINRGGKNLSESRKKVLEAAKNKLRKLYGE